jgi:hypothetical protein
MRRLLKRAAVAFVIVSAAAQLVRSEHTNPPTDPMEAAPWPQRLSTRR